MPKKATKISKKKAKQLGDAFDPIFDIGAICDAEEKSCRLTALSVNTTVDLNQTISTGILSLDLAIGGGLKAGAEYEIVGPEHGGKTTTLYSCFGKAIEFIPHHLKGIFIDVEGTIDQRWFKHIVGVDDLSDVFGESTSDGKYIRRPMIRYYKPPFGEQALKYLKRILKRMPDKILIGDTYHYAWRPKEKNSKTGYSTTELRKMLADKYNKKLYTKYGVFYVPVPNNYGGPELLVGVDSWAAMTPVAVSEDDNASLGQQARMFSTHLNDIKSLITVKGVTIIGANQVRQKPMAYGDSEYSPGGNTKKHTTDCRIRTSTVSNQNGSGQIEIDGSDEYRHFKMKIKKNKLYIPYQELKGRFWIKHAGKSGFGACPVQDCLEYLKSTSQVRMRSGGGFKIKFAGKDKLNKKLARFVFTLDSSKHGKKVKKGSNEVFISFKLLVLDKELDGKKFNLRQRLFKQLRSGQGMELALRGSETEE